MPDTDHGSQRPPEELAVYVKAVSLERAVRHRAWNAIVEDWEAAIKDWEVMGSGDTPQGLRLGFAHRTWDCEPHPSLGIALRFRILETALPRDTHYKLFEESKARLKRHFQRRLEIPRYEPPRLELNGTDLERENRLVLEHTLRGVSGGAVGRSLSAFMLKGFGEENAPEKFLRWLVGIDEPAADSVRNGVQTRIGGECRKRGGERSAGSVCPVGEGFIAPLKDRAALRFYSSKDRDTILTKIGAHLRATGGKSIYCVHAPGMDHALTALAVELFNTKANLDNRPWCYLPTSRNEEINADPTFRATVARLWAFYRDEDITRVNPEDGPSTEERLAEIRKRMSERAAVLVFDGYQDDRADGPAAPGATTTHLERLIRDEPLVALLERLVHPHVDLAAGTGPTEAFRRTRIIVLGNRPVATLEAHSVSRTNAFPGPEKEDLPAIIAAVDHDGSAFGSAQPPGVCSVVETITKEVELLGTRANGITIGLMRSLAALAREAHVEPGEALKKARGSGGTRTFGLVDHVLRAVKKRSEADFLALALLAYSGTGIRPSTLGRLFCRIRHGEGARWPMLGWSGVKADSLLEQLARLLQGLIVKGIDERLGGVPAANRGIEFNPLSPVEPDGSDTVFEIPDIDLRRDIRRFVSDKDVVLGRTLHLMLAEEAIQQHAALVRHAPAKKFLGLRYHRKLLEGIVHGFRSFQGVSDEGSAAEDARSYPVATSALPTSPAERLEALYAVHFRQQLEHAPDWWLSRMFGVDKAKAELLEMFLALPMVREPATPGLQAARNDAAENRTRALLSTNDIERMDQDAIARSSRATQIRADISILAGSDDARQEVEQALNLLVPPRDHAEACPALTTIDAVRHASVDQLGGLATVKAASIREVLEGSAKAIKKAIDLLEKAGVADVFAADHADRHVHTYRMAYVSFRTAHSLAQGRSGLSRAKPSGSATREFIRCCMKLATEDTALDTTAKAHLFMDAREAANRLALRLYRYPSERASLIVLESAFARLHAKDLDAAAALVAEAEAQLPNPINRPRLRMRWLLERVEVTKGLAVRADRSGNDELRRKLRSLALDDLAEVERLAGAGARVYASLAEQQKEHLDLAVPPEIPQIGQTARPTSGKRSPNTKDRDASPAS